MKLVATLHKSLASDVSDFLTLKPHVRFLLAFHLIILFLVSILIGIVASPTFFTVVQFRPDSVLDTVPTPGVTLPAQQTTPGGTLPAQQTKPGSTLPAQKTAPGGTLPAQKTAPGAGAIAPQITLPTESVAPTHKLDE